MARRRVWTAWMIALVAFLTLLGSARALHNTPAPTPAPSSTDHHHDDDHHVEIAPDDVYPARTRYRHGAPTAEWIPASYQMGEEDFDLAFQASANGIVRVDVWGYLRVYYRRVVDKETFTPYYYLFNNWNPHRNEYGVDYELYSTYTAALNRDDSDDSTPTCNDVKEAFANEPGSFPGKGFPYGCEFMEGDFGYMYKSTGSQVGFDGARALERDPESCSRVMNGTFACDTASAAKHDFLFPHGWRVYLESPQPLSERWHPPPDVQFVTLAPNAGVEGEGDLDVAGEVDQFTIRTRARVVEAGKVFALYRTAGTGGTPDPSDPFLVLKARTVDAKTVFELFVDTGVDGCEVTLVTNASWTEPESVDLAVTYDDGAAAVYVDGSLDAMGSMPAECVSPTTKPTQWRLGDAGSGMAGDVNFLTVWSRTALAPWRVRRAALADYSHVPPPDHHFNFDEPPGTTEVTNSIDNGRRSSASLDPGCEIVGVHDGSLAQLDTPLAVLDADVHVHVPWTSKLAKVFQGSFSMQMWVKPGGDVEEDVELNIFGNYDVSDPEFGDCSCACDGKPVANGSINVTDDQGAMGVTSRQCAAAGPEECGDMVTDGVIDACPGGVDFTAVWSYNQSYTGANFDDGDGDDGMLFGDCGCLCEGNETGVVNVTAFPGYLNGSGVPEAVCSVAGPGYCQMMTAHPAFPACNVDFTTDWRPNNTYSGALYELGDCTCTCDGANMGVLDGCDSSTKAALNQSRVGCGLYPWECGTACSTIGTCGSGLGSTHELVEAYSYGGGDWGGGGGGGRKLLSHDDDQAYEYDPAENYVRLYLQKLTNDTYAVKMEIRSGVGTQPMTLTGDNVTADEWYHFALERDVSRGTLGYYLNGIKRSDLDIGTEALTNGKNVNLLSSMLDNGLGIFAAGARSVNSSVNFSASFSDFMIYSDAVGSSFPAGPGMCSTPRVDNLIMWLPLDNMDASDHSTVDASGYHHRAFVRGSFVYEPTPVATWNYAEHRLVSSWTSPQNDIKIVKDRSAAPCRPWTAEEGCDEPVPLDCSSCLSSMGFDTGECGLKAIGGEISFADGYTIHTFKESGTFTILQLGIKNLEVFAVGGGGGGGKLEEIDDQDSTGLRGCEVVCEGHGYNQTQCEAIVGCGFDYDDGECWSAVGPNPCDSDPYSEGPTPSPDSGSGGGAECRCYCDQALTQYVGYVNGITSEQCIQDGPTSTTFGCPGSESYFSQTCDTYYVEYVANPGGTTGRKLMQGSGPTPAPSPSLNLTTSTFLAFRVAPVGTPVSRSLAMRSPARRRICMNLYKAAAAVRCSTLTSRSPSARVALRELTGRTPSYAGTAGVGNCKEVLPEPTNRISAPAPPGTATLPTADTPRTTPSAATPRRSLAAALAANIGSIPTSRTCSAGLRAAPAATPRPRSARMVPATPGVTPAAAAAASLMLSKVSRPAAAAPAWSSSATRSTRSGRNIGATWRRATTLRRPRLFPRLASRMAISRCGGPARPFPWTGSRRMTSTGFLRGPSTSSGPSRPACGTSSSSRTRTSSSACTARSRLATCTSPTWRASRMDGARISTGTPRSRTVTPWRFTRGDSPRARTTWTRARRSISSSPPATPTTTSPTRNSATASVSAKPKRGTKRARER